MESEVSNIAWAKEFETGNDVLDAQHQRYFDLLNDYFDKAAEKTTTPEKVMRLTESFNFFFKYAEKHFSTEESIMKHAEYPEYKLHQEEHLYFVRHVEQLYKDMGTKGFSPELAREVNYFTVEWFIEHIRVTDMKVVEFLKKKELKV